MNNVMRKTIRVGILASWVLGCLGPLASSMRAASFYNVAPICFTKPFGGADPLPQTIALASADGTNFAFSGVASTSSGGSWLSVTGLYGGNLVGTTPEFAAIVVHANVTLAAGTYYGQVVFTTGATSLTISVTLTIAPVATPFFDNVPGGLNFSLPTAAGNPPSQTVQIRNGGTGTLPWTLTQSTADGGSWLTVSAPGGSAPSLVTVSVNVANLPNAALIAGTFVGQLLFQTGGSSVTIPVTVVVADNVLNQINALNFTKPYAGANPLPQVLNIASSGANINFSGIVSTATGGNWLSVTGLYGGNLAGTSPEVAQIVVNPIVTLAAGTYTGQVVFSSGGQAITVGVTLTVGAPGTPFFDNVQGAMNFSLQTAVGIPPSQTVQIRNGGSGALTWTLAKSTADSGNWLKVSATSGTAPSLVTVSIVPQNLPNEALIAGTFTGEIVFLSSGSSVTIPISVTVGANVLRQINALSFTKVFGGANPLPQVLLPASTGSNINFSGTVSTGTGGSWLSVSGLYGGGLAGTAPEPALVNVIASPTLAVGTYTGQFVISSGGQAVTVGITLKVAAATDTYFDNIQGGMNFTMATAGAAPANQTVQIRNAGTGLLNWTLTPSTADGANWLTVSSSGGTAPSTISVGVIVDSLPGLGLIAGSFTGELVFQATSGMATIPVTVVVGTSVFVQLPSLNFSKQVGGANPLSQTIPLASTGSSIEFSSTVSSSAGGNWLSVTGLYGGTLAGTTPETPSAVISASPALAAGTYTGQVVFNAGNEAMTMPVNFNAGSVPVAPPFGSFDTPINNSNVAGAIAVTGWALSYIGVTNLSIYREPVPGEGTALIFVGTADFVAGARPDLAGAYPNYPYNDRGWGLQLLTNELPGTNGQIIGNGTYTLHAIASDTNGLATDLGSKTITVNNAGSNVPFGTLDTPTQGGIASGSAYVNFGWALTPLPNLIPIDGKTIWVYIDNVAKGHPAYNYPRPDIEALFPGYLNTDGAVGYFVIDTTQLTNGLHTIFWVVTDNAGNANGLGSRYFTVQN